MISKSWGKIAVRFSYILNTFFNIPLGFHESIQVVPLKYLMCVFVGINTK